MSSKLPSVGAAHSLGRRWLTLHRSIDRSRGVSQCQRLSVLHTLGVVLSLASVVVLGELAPVNSRNVGNKSLGRRYGMNGLRGADSFSDVDASATHSGCSSVAWKLKWRARPIRSPMSASTLARASDGGYWLSCSPWIAASRFLFGDLGQPLLRWRRWHFRCRLNGRLGLHLGRAR